MPKSRVRRKTTYTKPQELQRKPRSARPSPQWLPVLALSMLGIGIAWLVVYYLSQGKLPIGAIGPWNLLVGFGLFVLSLGVFTQWR